MSAVLAPAAAQRGDRRLAVAGVLAIAVAAGTAVARRLGVVPEGWAVAAILAIGSVSLGVVVRFIGTRASAEQRARVATRIASVGLALSTTAVALLLPGLTEDAGWATFAADVVAQLWSVAVLFVLAAPGRTLGWRVALSMGFVGFLALPSAARLVGVPVLTHVGENDPMGHSLWVPLTENLLMLLPVLLAAALAARRARRPSALDLMLLGA